MSHEEDAIHVISRFGLEMGVGDQTILEACEEHGVHTATFLSIINYKVFKHKVSFDNVDIPTLQQYLCNAHTYFLDFRLPNLRRSLIEALIGPRLLVGMHCTPDLQCRNGFSHIMYAHNACAAFYGHQGRCDAGNHALLHRQSTDLAQ